MNDTIGLYAAIGAAVGVSIALLMNRKKKRDDEK